MGQRRHRALPRPTLTIRPLHTNRETWWRGQRPGMREDDGATTPLRTPCRRLDSDKCGWVLRGWEVMIELEYSLYVLV